MIQSVPVVSGETTSLNGPERRILLADSEARPVGGTALPGGAPKEVDLANGNSADPVDFDLTRPN